jgi:hypothetical protein
VKYLGLTESNEILGDRLSSKIPFYLARPGIGEIEILNAFISNKVDSGLMQRMKQGGIFSQDFLRLYSESIRDADLLTGWNAILDESQTVVFRKLKPGADLLHHRVVEPYYVQSDPWTKSLNDCKVLIVSIFSESMRMQQHRLDKVWEGKVMFGNCKLDFVIPPFAPDCSKSWVEHFEILKDKVHGKTFDLALLSCGTFGLPLGKFIRDEMRSSAIYVGGSLQLYFGIKGKRWDLHEEISAAYNESWIRPVEAMPDSWQIMDDGCYW